jgi:hypothetical protein
VEATTAAQAYTYTGDTTVASGSYTFPYGITNIPPPKPCPSCGRCPTCQPYAQMPYYGPWWGYLPYRVWC